MHTTDMPIAFGDVRRSFFQSIVIMIFKIDIGLKQTKKISRFATQQLQKVSHHGVHNMKFMGTLR